MKRGRPRAYYEISDGGEVAARGTVEQCARALGLSVATVKRYAAPSRESRFDVRRITREELEDLGTVARGPDPRISAEELREAMRRRHDEMFGLLPDWEA